MPAEVKPDSGMQGGFLRAVALLVSGTALAHGITAAAMPLLSRLYSPGDFGLLAVLSGALGIVGVVGCLRYELAIALPATDDDALQLLALSLLCCLGLATVLAGLVLLAPNWLTQLLGQPGLRPYLWLLPLGLLLAGLYSALQFWHVRTRQFHRLAHTRVAQSAGSAATQVGLGFADLSPLGLLLGYVLNTGIACLGLRSALVQAFRVHSWQRMRALAIEYRRFPLYSSLEALANSIALQLPVILIANIAAPSEAGYLMLAMYVAQAPMSLIGTSISQVYLSRAPEMHRTGRLGEFTAEIFGGLLKAGCGPLIAAALLSPMLFGLVFGAAWERAGWLVAFLTPSFLLQFLATPVSMALHVCGRQRAAFLMQLTGLLVRVGLVWAVGQWLPAQVSEAYAASGALFYLAYVILILVIAQAPLSSLLTGVRRAVPLTLAWAGVAALLAYGVRSWR